MRRNILINLLCLLFIFIFFSNSSLFAGQCLTFDGYKRLNTNPDNQVCKLKYTTLEFGPKNFCKKEKSCNTAGILSLKQSVSYRKADIQRLNTCLSEIEKGTGDLVHKCPSYEDIYNRSVLDGGIKPTKELVAAAIVTLKSEVNQIESIINQIKRKTIETFLESFDETIENISECITAGVETAVNAIGEAYTIADNTLKTVPTTLEDYGYKGQVESDDELARGINQSIEDQLIERIKHGELKIPEIVRDIQLGKIGKEEGARILNRISNEVPAGDEAILNTYVGMALAHIWAGGKVDEAPKEEDLKTAFNEIKNALHKEKYGTYALVTEAIKLAREKGDTKKANELTVQFQRLRQWDNSLAGREKNPADFLLTVEELQKWTSYFGEVSADYRGEEYEGDHTKFTILQNVADGAMAVSDGAKYSGTAIASLMGPGAATAFYASVNEAQGAIKRLAGQEPPLTVSDIHGKVVEYGTVYLGGRLLTPRAPKITSLPPKPAVSSPRPSNPKTPKAPKFNLSDKTIAHLKGDFNNGELKGGLHLADDFEQFLKNSNISPKSVKIYPNGVQSVELPREAFTSKGWEKTVNASNWENGVPGGKTIFPKNWTSEKIAKAVRHIIKPKNWIHGEKVNMKTYEGVYKGVKMRVTTAKEKNGWRIVSSYPTWIQP